MDIPFNASVQEGGILYIHGILIPLGEYRKGDYKGNSLLDVPSGQTTYVTLHGDERPQSTMNFGSAAPAFVVDMDERIERMNRRADEMENRARQMEEQAHKQEMVTYGRAMHLQRQAERYANQVQKIVENSFGASLFYYDDEW